MLKDNDLHELLNFQAKQPVLSVYLNTDPAQGTTEVHKLHLRSMLKDVDLPKDVTGVIRYFDHEHDWSGQSVAVFSCAPERFLRVFSLAVPLRSRVRVLDRPYVKPLADLLDSYGGYGVVLVDKQGARLFHFHLGELEEQEGMVGEAVRRTKRGGGSQAAGRRGGVAGQTDHNDEVAERNIRDAVGFATKFFATRNVRRIMIGGTDDNIALFRSQLPKAWQSLVAGTFPMSMVASHAEVLSKALDVCKEVDRRRGIQLANAVVTSAAKLRGGVIHLEDTLNAIREGRVLTLLIREGFRAPGNRCKSCGFLSSLPMDKCPFCSGLSEKVPDAVEVAVRQVMQTGGDVEVLQSDQVVKGFEQIGAILRY